MKSNKHSFKFLWGKPALQEVEMRGPSPQGGPRCQGLPADPHSQGWGVQGVQWGWGEWTQSLPMLKSRSCEPENLKHFLNDSKKLKHLKIIFIFI